MRTLLLFVPLATSCAASAAVQDEPDAGASEVIVIGALHAPFQFRHPDYTPAHVEAALVACDPDVVAVESNPTWFARGEFYPVTYEAQAIAVPWAEERGIPVRGVDWMDIESWDRRLEEDRRSRHGWISADLARGPLPMTHFGRVPESSLEELDSTFRAPNLGFDSMNAPGDNGWLPPGDPTDPGWGGERNQRIFQHALGVLEAHPGQRLAIVIGGGHKEVLDALFETVEGVRLLSFGEDVPLPASDAIAEGWSVRHLVAALGHNLDGERTYFHPELVDLHRMRALVDRLASHRAQGALATYFRGRIQYMEGDFVEALRSFRALHEVFGQREPHPFPMDHWRMQYGWAHSILLEEARTLLALDRRAEAEEILARLPDELPPVPDPETVPGRTRDVLSDAGFEEGRLEGAPGTGWFSDEVQKGAQRARLDTEAPHGGQGSLRLEVLRDREHGLASLIQSVAISAAMREAGELELSVHARAEGIPYLRPTAYRWEDERGMVHLASTTIDLGESWTEARVTVPVPEDAERIHVFLYFPAEAGDAIWFDDASLFEEPEVRIPEEWVPRTLAREFPRALLAVE